ncbi:MAG: hypothetical protein WCI97_08420 [Bacteroidota bacterium]
MNRISTFFFLFFSIQTFGQSTYLYHSFKETASNFKIVQWNISPDSLPVCFIKETIDARGRVAELNYYKNGTTDFQTICYLFPIIKFEYPNDSTIIQYNLSGDGEKQDGLECATPYKTIFHLSHDNLTIKNSDSEFYVDTSYWLNNGLTHDSIKKQLAELKNNEMLGAFVNGYEDSYAKLNGLFPIANDFNFKDIYFSQLEKKEIERILGKK